MFRQRPCSQVPPPTGLNPWPTAAWPSSLVLPAEPGEAFKGWSLWWPQATEHFKHSRSALSPANSAEPYDRSGRAGIRENNSEYFSGGAELGGWLRQDHATVPEWGPGCRSSAPCFKERVFHMCSTCNCRMGKGGWR